MRIRQRRVSDVAASSKIRNASNPELDFWMILLCRQTAYPVQKDIVLTLEIIHNQMKREVLVYLRCTRQESVQECITKNDNTKKTKNRRK